ncbi:hypothetical protein ACFLY9_00300 [Patescibacteria group bacterium]
MSELPDIPASESQLRLFCTIASGKGYPLTIRDGNLVLNPWAYLEEPTLLHGQLYVGTASATDLHSGQKVDAIITEFGAFVPQGKVQLMQPTMFTTGDGQILHLPQSS